MLYLSISNRNHCWSTKNVARKYYLPLSRRVYYLVKASITHDICVTNCEPQYEEAIFFRTRKFFTKNALRLCQVENEIFKRSKEAFSPHQSHWWDTSSWQEKRQLYAPVSISNLSAFWEFWRKFLSKFFFKEKMREKMLISKSPFHLLNEHDNYTIEFRKKRRSSWPY